MSYKILAKFLARFWQDHARQSRQKIAKMCYTILAKFLVRFWQDHARQSRQEIAKMCYNLLSFLQDFGKILQGSPVKKLPRLCYKIRAKFLARFWQDHARQSRQEIAKMCYKILDKFLARF